MLQLTCLSVAALAIISIAKDDAKDDFHSNEENLFQVIAQEEANYVKCIGSNDCKEFADEDDAQNSLGFWYYRNGDYPKPLGITCWEAISLNPDNKVFHCNLRIDSAVAKVEFRKALAIDTDYQPARDVIEIIDEADKIEKIDGD